MNTYARNLNPETVKINKNQEGRIKFAGFAAKVSFLILLIFFAIAAQMHLRAEIERLNKRATGMQAKISQLNVQCTNLRNRKEMLTGWQHIQSRIRHFHLKLRQADHRQVSHISLDLPRSARRNFRTVQDSGERGYRRAYARSER